MSSIRGFSDDIGDVEGKFAHTRASKLAHNPVLLRLRNAIGVSIRDTIAIAVAIHMGQIVCLRGGGCGGGVMAAVGEGSGGGRAHGPENERELRQTENWT